ncbi:MAG: hypothetical protein ABJC36_10645 [Gemmatimonadales bacterium]
MAAREIDELILVYNADAGKVSALVDSARKLFRLNGCSLCSITHGPAGERTEWQECKTALGVPISHHHRDDMPPDIRQAVGDQFPSILARTGATLVPLLSPDGVARCNGKVADLRGRLRHNARLLGLALP